MWSALAKMGRFALLSAAVTSAGYLCPAPAFAQPGQPPAEELDRQARSAYAEGRYVEAARLFEEAAQLVPAAELSFNAALAWDKAGDSPRAADAYERALALGDLDDSREKSTNSRLGVLKAQLGYVWVQRPVGGTVTVAHVQGAIIPTKFHLHPGKHALRIADASGKSQERVVEARAGTLVPVAVNFGGELVEARKRAEPSAPPPPPDRKDDRVASGPGPWPWIAFGAAAGFTGATVYLGLRTQQSKRDFNDSDNRDEAALDEGRGFQLLTNISLGAAVLSAGAGVYLLLSSDGLAAQPALGGQSKSGSVHIVTGPTDVRLRLKF